MSKYADTGIDTKLIDEIVSMAKLYGVKKVILFGSRARGDHKEKSDIDIAFLGGDASRFVLAVDEDTKTLLDFDIVDLGGVVQEDLRDSIKKEGVTLYEEI